MSAFAIFLMLFTIVCYTVQNFFNKMYSISYDGPSAAATPVFASIYGLITGIATLAYNGFTFAPTLETWLFGIANGGILFLFNLSNISASRRGPYAFQSVMMLFGSIVLPLLFSTIWLREQIGSLQFIGIFLMLVSFILFNLKGLKLEGRKKGYLMWVGLLFMTNGIYGILMDSQQRVAHQTQRNEMIVITFIVSAIISIAFLLGSQKRDSLKAFHMCVKARIFLLGSSIAAAVAVNFLMYTLSVVPASILFAMNNGGVLVLSALLSAVVLHEKLEKHMIIGLAVAVASLVLLSV